MKRGGLREPVSAHPPAPAPVQRKPRWADRGTEGEFASLGAMRAVPWIPGCRWMPERAAARRSLPPRAACPRRPGGRSSGGSSRRRGHGAGLPEEQRGSPSSGAPSPPRAGGSARGSRDSHPRRGSDAPSTGLTPALPTSPRSRGERRARPAPPRPAEPTATSLATQGVVTAPQRASERAPIQARSPRRSGRRGDGSGRGCGARAVARTGRGAPVRANAGGWARVILSRWGGVEGSGKFRPNPGMNRKPESDSARRNHLQQLPHSSH